MPLSGGVVTRGALVRPGREHVRMPGEADPAAAASPGTPPTLVLVGLGVLITVAWACAVWVCAHVHADPALRAAALFVHLASLVVGLGAVMTIDFFAVQWLAGRRPLTDVLRVASGGHALVWGGLAGLVLSGVLLSPDLGSPLTWLKLVLVLLVALNGLHAYALQQRLEGPAYQPRPRRLLVRSAAAATVSQLGWWGAVGIGLSRTMA